MAFTLEDTKCSKCNKKGDLVYWRKDETEEIDEIYVTCDNCNYEYPKEFVDKSEGPTEKIAQKIVSKY